CNNGFRWHRGVRHPAQAQRSQSPGSNPDHLYQWLSNLYHSVGGLLHGGRCFANSNYYSNAIIDYYLNSIGDANRVANTGRHRHTDNHTYCYPHAQTRPLTNFSTFYGDWRSIRCWTVAIFLLLNCYISVFFLQNLLQKSCDECIIAEESIYHLNGNTRMTCSTSCCCI